MSDEPVVAQKSPYQVELEAGRRYFWCKCGKSKKQPFCDGSHKGSGIEPLAFTTDAAGVYNLCGCKQTDDQPFCDGTHNVV